MSTTRRRLAGPSLVLGISLLVAGCGGGGSSNPSPPVPTPSPTPTPTGGTCASGSSHGHRSASRAQSAVVPNRLYVTYRNAAGARDAQSIDRIAGAARGLDLGNDNGLAHRAITLAAGTDTARATAALKASPGVVSVQPLHTRSLVSNANPPADPFFDNVHQWYLFKTDVFPDGWSPTTDGAGVDIAVIDTGIDETNNDLTPKIGIRESIVGGVKTVGSSAAGDRTVQDTNGHGTNVAGLAATDTNNGIGFAGVGYNARLQIYKIFPDATASSDCQTADSGDESAAIRDAVANNASVINLSLGAPQAGGFDQAEHDAVEFAIANGVVVVAAGGNDSAAVPDFPGGYPGVISVGASALADSNSGVYSQNYSEPIASYSNSGVTLVAPGGDTTSTSDQDLLHWIEGYSTSTAAFAADKCNTPSPATSCLVLFNGTSQATPQVSGTVALMEADHGGPKSLLPATVLSIFQNPANSDNIGATTAQQGAGRLNAGKAVQAAHNHAGP